MGPRNTSNRQTALSLAYFQRVTFLTRPRVLIFVAPRVRKHTFTTITEPHCSREKREMEQTEKGINVEGI